MTDLMVLQHWHHNTKEEKEQENTPAMAASMSVAAAAREAAVDTNHSSEGRKGSFFYILVCSLHDLPAQAVPEGTYVGVDGLSTVHFTAGHLMKQDTSGKRQTEWGKQRCGGQYPTQPQHKVLHLNGIRITSRLQATAKTLKISRRLTGTNSIGKYAATTSNSSSTNGSSARPLCISAVTRENTTSKLRGSPSPSTAATRPGNKERPSSLSTVH
ncbi:hypothetical protein E2C01_010242 [Portunus trituberculatus]|uniref:Uncharacterized protein n=1 Tax=Portunus trituberculatus TaxID=210409 RepID=A0A5B7D7X6_PORTR|nr:hypothetical protein [Portunus trituberculatus]